jgi:preprotein translocase subunit SecY
VLAALVNAWRVPDLRKKILYSAFLLFVYRLGSFIPAPGVDTAKVAEVFQSIMGETGGGLLGLVDMFSGGSLQRLSVFAVNVGSYITASIVMELLTVVIPSLEELSKEGPEGRKKISQYTRYAAVGLALLQAYGYSAMFKEAIRPGAIWTLLVILSMSAGAAFVIWLGEKISEKGIGNGISLIIFAGIVTQLPGNVRNVVSLAKSGGAGPVLAVVYVVMSLALIIGVVAMSEGQRRVPVQYPKRVVGRRVYGGQSLLLLRHRSSCPRTE